MYIPVSRALAGVVVIVPEYMRGQRPVELRIWYAISREHAELRNKFAEPVFPPSKLGTTTSPGPSAYPPVESDGGAPHAARMVPARIRHCSLSVGETDAGSRAVPHASESRTCPTVESAETRSEVIAKAENVKPNEVATGPRTAEV